MAAMRRILELISALANLSPTQRDVLASSVLQLDTHEDRLGLE